MAWVYGKYFGLDLDIQFFGLDDQAVNQMKYRPAKLDGRAERLARYESIERMCERIVEGDTQLEIFDIIDEEPDVIGEHLAQKALRRKHRDSEHYRKVRQDYAGGWGHFDLRTAKKELRRSSRRKLNNKAMFADKDYVGKHGSLFSDVEPWSVRGWRNLGGKVEVDG